MPDFKLPSGRQGWIVAIIAALVGMLAGGIAIKVMRGAL